MWFETATTVEQYNPNHYKGTSGFQQPISHFHLRWAPVSRGINFDRITTLFSQMVNHYEGHAEISTKNKLFKNITKWHDENHQLVFKNMLPLTFCLKLPVHANGEVDKKSLNFDIKPFKQAFNLL